MEIDPFRTRAHVADFDTIVEEIVSASARARETLPMMANIAYGPADNETLDIFFPDGARENLPVHLFIHGGYWRMFSKLDYSYVAETITGAGALAVIIEYGKMPAVRMHVIVEQIKRAREWISDHIAAYGGAPSRLTVSGHSAGAHLATFLIRKGMPAPEIKAALLLGGIYNLQPLQTSFLAPEIGITDAEVAVFSPMAHSYDAQCRVIVAVGGDETPPFHHQANAFVVSLKEQGLSASLQTINGANHMTSVRDLGRPDTATAAMLIELISNSSIVKG